MARKRARLAATFVTATLFISGASLATALSALAEDGSLGATDTGAATATGLDETAATTTDPAPEVTTTEEAPPASTTDPASDSSPPPDPSSPPPAEDPPPTPPSPSETPEPPWQPAPSAGAAPSASFSAPPDAPGPEIESRWAYATIWLHRSLPDPTPPAQRLSPAFARQLRAASERAGVRWSLVLAVLRMAGHDGRVPVGRTALDHVAGRLARVRVDSLGEQVGALDRYNRAVGLHALVSGFEAAKPVLERRLLADRRVTIYPAGRADVSTGRIDVRVLILVRYLAVTFGQVTVSSLHSGHRYYAQPGVVSAHVYGLAVDIAAVGGSSVRGHQGLGSVTEQAVESILVLPVELQPQQVISLLGLGGPSFPLADHYDHIHVGF
jgi:hypothetical protein